MKYQNGQVISMGAERLAGRQGTRGDLLAKPHGETDYIKQLKAEVERREQEGKTLGL
jgi:hypothetical protein